MLIIKNCMLAIALIVGVSGAFASKAANSGKSDSSTYNWTGESGHPGNLNGKTVMEAQIFYGCSGTGELCAKGELVSGSDQPNERIYQNN